MMTIASTTKHTSLNAGVRSKSDTELGKSIIHQMLREEAMRDHSSIAAIFLLES